MSRGEPNRSDPPPGHGHAPPPGSYSPYVQQAPPGHAPAAPPPGYNPYAPPYPQPGPYGYPGGWTPTPPPGPYGVYPPPMGPPPPALPRPGRGLVLLLWFMIIFGLLATWVVRWTEAANFDSSLNSDERAALEDEQAATLGLYLTRYLMALRELQVIQGSAGRQTVNELISIIEQSHPSVENRLRVAILYGEFGNPDEALDQLQWVTERTSPSDPAHEDARALEKIYNDKRQALSSAYRQRLLDRHGWFGKLALAYGMPESDPMRSSIDTRARWAAATLVTIVLLVGGAALAGVVLGILFIVKASGRTFTWRYRPPPPSRETSLLEIVALFFIAFVGVAMLDAALNTQFNINISFLLYWSLALVFAWPMLRGKTWARLRDDLGWHSGRGLLKEIGAGTVGYIAGVPLVIAGAIATLILQNIWVEIAGGEAPLQPTMLPGDSIIEILMFFAMLCVWAPIVEETVFRGAFYGHLRQHMRTNATTPWGQRYEKPAPIYIVALITGLIFAALHPDWLVRLPVLTAIGVVLALIREWRGSLIGPMVAHAINNFIIGTFILVMMAP